MTDGPRTLAEIRAALQGDPEAAASFLRQRRGKLGSGAYVAPYDGPRGVVNAGSAQSKNAPIKLTGGPSNVRK